MRYLRFVGLLPAVAAFVLLIGVLDARPLTDDSSTTATISADGQISCTVLCHWGERTIDKTYQQTSVATDPRTKTYIASHIWEPAGPFRLNMFHGVAVKELLPEGASHNPVTNSYYWPSASGFSITYRVVPAVAPPGPGATAAGAGAAVLVAVLAQLLRSGLNLSQALDRMANVTRPEAAARPVSVLPEGAVGGPGPDLPQTLLHLATTLGQDAATQVQDILAGAEVFPLEGPPEPLRRPEPRDKGECEAFLYDFDQMINLVQLALQRAIDEYDKVALRKAQYHRTAVEARLVMLQAEMEMAKLGHAIIGEVGWAITGGITWATLASLFGKIDVRWATVAAWGIGQGRAYELTKLVHQRWDDLRLASHLFPERHALYRFLGTVWQAAQAYVEFLEAEAASLDAIIARRTKVVEGLKKELDQLWAFRDQTYETCEGRGLLPEGTWQRQKPSYLRDSRGNIIGMY